MLCPQLHGDGISLHKSKFDRAFYNVKPFFINITVRPVAEHDEKLQDFRIKGGATNQEIQVTLFFYIIIKLYDSESPKP